MVKTLAKPPSGQVLYFDTDLKGFGILVSSKTDTRSFIIQKTLPGDITRRKTLGRTDVLSVEQARGMAKVFIAQCYAGIDPIEEKKKRHEEKIQKDELKKKEEKKQSFTLRMALEIYLQHARIKPQTKDDYLKRAERYLGEWLDKPLRDITREMVIERHAEITIEVQKRSKGKKFVKGHGTSNGTMRILRVVWNDARERVADLPENPVRGMRRYWHKDTRRDTYVRPSEIPAFVDGAMRLENPIHRAFVLFTLFTGMRRTEAAALRWDEVDYENRVIKLASDRTKNGKGLDLPMSDYVMKLLQECEKPVRQGDYVFPSPTSKSGHIEEPKFILDRVGKLSGVYVTCHDLRRTFITVAESCEISPYALKGLVNHSYGGDVTAGYIVSNVERLRQPMALVEQRLLALINKPKGSDGQNIVPFKSVA